MGRGLYVRGFPRNFHLAISFNCHPRESGDPSKRLMGSRWSLPLWIPAFAGMTKSGDGNDKNKPVNLNLPFMSFLKSLQRWFSKDWFLSLLVLGIYLATNRYAYAWDDQHLEITLLKHLIDPTLYAGDYYVESLVQNFTSWMYPLLAKFITVDQIPAAYLVFFLISRYFLFYWWFKLWHLIAVQYGRSFEGKLNFRLVAFCCVVTAIVLGRTEEFLYRTFSHQEFALGIIFAAVYFFFKERFFLAAIIFGIAANFHALYALYPMIYMSVYLLFFHRDRERRVEIWFKTGSLFVLSCLPFLAWTLSKALRIKIGADPHLFDNWIPLYLLACPQNFPFGVVPVSKVLSDAGIFLSEMRPFLILVVLYVLNAVFCAPFRRDKKIQAIALSVVLMILTCFYFAYIHPDHFILDLNLIRNEQYLRLFLFGYSTILIARLVEEKNLLSAFLYALIFIFMGGNNLLGIVAVSLCAVLLVLMDFRRVSMEVARHWLLVVMMALVALAFVSYQKIQWSEIHIVNYKIMVFLILGYALIEFFSRQKIRLRLAVIILPLVYLISFWCYHHYQFVEITTKGGGFWQLQRNWEDMQRYVKGHTPKDAFILTPYNMEMGGFRVLSERKVLVCYRDCGIVGFDYKAALEWQKRIADVQEYKVITDPKSIAPALLSALLKYNVDYIVFMSYYAPGNNEFVQKMYENEVFALYKVTLKRD